MRQLDGARPASRHLAPLLDLRLDRPKGFSLNRLDETLLANLPPFARLSRREIRDILDQASARRHEQGTPVFREGDAAERFYLLLDGYIRVVRTTTEGEHVIALHIAAGQLFGIAAALGRDTYPATAMTAVDCVALSWPMRLWHQFCATYEGFSTESYKIVGNRVGEMQARIAEMATQAVEQRVAAALLRLVNQTGRKAEGGIEIGFPITRQDIAEMTGTTLHTVSRLMSAWQKQGIVESRRRQVLVIQPHQLVELSEGHSSA